MGTRLGDVVGLPEPALRLSDVLRGGDEWREGRARMARLARGEASLSLSGWGRALLLLLRTHSSLRGSHRTVP